MAFEHIQLRRDTAANWTANNPILFLGETGWETDTLKTKLGDGTTTWNSLAYANITPAQLASPAAGQGDELLTVQGLGPTAVLQHIINGAIVIPEMWGAVSGAGVSGAVRTANTVALNAAMQACMAINGTLDLSSVYETNGPVWLGSATQLQPPKNWMIAGLRSRGSIVGFGAGNVLDGTGCRFLTLSNFTVQSSTAAIGLLAARTAISGDCQSWVMDNVVIMGSFTNAPFVSIAAEDLRVSKCQFWNSTVGGYTYRSSPNNTIIAAASTFGAIVASTNTDIRFHQCYFYANTNGGSSNGIGLDTGFAGSFSESIMLCDAVTVGNVAYGVRINPGAGNAFSGKVVFDKCQWELQTSTGPSSMCLFDNGAVLSSYFGVDFINNMNALVGAGSAAYFAWTNIAYAEMYDCTFANNLAPYGQQPTLKLCYLNRCKIHAEYNLVTLNGSPSFSATQAVVYSEVIGLNITWGASMTGVGSLIRDMTLVTTGFGCQPSPSNNPIPSVYKGDSAARLVIGPEYYPSVSPLRGELSVHDMAYSYFPAITLVTGASNSDVLAFFNGRVTKPVGAYPGTPASGAASGVEGMVLYDAAYIYVCTASGTAGGGTVASVTATTTLNSNVLTLAGANAANVKAVPFGFINIVGLTGPQQYVCADGVNVFLAQPAAAAVAGAAVTWSVPVWRRAAVATW